MKRLQGLYSHLQSEYPDLPANLRDHPEKLLQMLMQGGGDFNAESLLYAGREFSEEEEEEEEESVDWELAYDDGKFDIGTYVPTCMPV